MTYLILVYPDAAERVGSAGSDPWPAGAMILRDSGHLLAGGDLSAEGSAVRLTVRSGEVIFDTAPSTGGAGRPAGLFVIDARDLNEAIQLAAKLPQAASSLLEVRPAIL